MNRTSAQILADATSAMVQDLDVTDALATLLRDCAEVLSAGVVGLLIRSDRGEIELLSSTSHAMAVLELLQCQQATGPCVEAISCDSAISVVDSADILARWPDAGPLSVAEVSERIRSALSGRTVIEQAKGVISFRRGLDMARAYDVLVRTAKRNGTSLTLTARGIVTSAEHGSRPV